MSTYVPCVRNPLVRETVLVLFIVYTNCSTVRVFVGNDLCHTSIKSLNSTRLNTTNMALLFLLASIFGALALYVRCSALSSYSIQS